MANYQEAKVKLTNIKLNKLKPGAKNKIGTRLRITKRNYNGKDLPHELYPKTRQKTGKRNAFSNDKTTDIKFSEAQLSKMIHWGGFLRNMLGN